MTIPEIITHLRETARYCEHAANHLEQTIKGGSPARTETGQGGTGGNLANKGTRQVRTMSAAGRRKISAAQKARWAVTKGGKAA
jgi:hypothetical protein